MSSNDGQRDPGLGPFSLAASDADEEPAYAEPVRTTSAGRHLLITHHCSTHRCGLPARLSRVLHEGTWDLGVEQLRGTRWFQVKPGLALRVGPAGRGNLRGTSLLVVDFVRMMMWSRHTLGPLPTRRRIVSSKSPVLPSRPVAQALLTFRSWDRHLVPVI